MTERRRFLAGLLALAVLAPARAQGRGMTPLSPAMAAPALRLKDADDQWADLASYKGRVILVNFWATWCPPCRKEFPSLGRVRRLFPTTDFAVIAVNVGEDPDSVFSFTGLTEFPVLFDQDAKAMATWSVRGLPTTYLVDRQGQVAYRATGGREFDAADIVAIIRQLLNT